MVRTKIIFFFITLLIAFYLIFVPTVILARRKNHTVTPSLDKVLTPTPTSFIPTPTLSPTPTRVKLIKVIPSPTKILLTPTTASPSVSSYLLSQVNSYRTSLGLSVVNSNETTCSFASIRAQEISTGFNHDGFNNRAASHTLPYPSYHEVTENIAMNSNYKDVVNQWINSPGHAENMRRNTPFVCVMQFGNYYAYEGLRP